MTQLMYDINIAKLNLWNQAYYEDDNPMASDEEYDSLYRKIKEYENSSRIKPVQSSPTINVGIKPSSSRNKGNHLKQMMSQQDIFNIDELKKWINTRSMFTNISFICEPKYDGVSLNLVYEYGVLQKAITRGDGYTGEDVTLNAKTIKSIPQYIEYQGLIEIRGEVVIKKHDFNDINIQRKRLGEEQFANPRNAASGSLRHEDISIVANRKLYFQAWGVGENHLSCTTEIELMNFVYKQGFKKGPYSKVCHSLADIENVYKYFIKERTNFEIGLDGMLIKINLLTHQQQLGCTAKYPKHACAYKFPATQKVTIVKGIKLQVGRSGTITPVAILEPIHIDGSTVSKATLHNFDEIKRLDLMLNDQVILIKSGDIIPKITQVLYDRRDGSEIKFTIPSQCPDCKSQVNRIGASLKCENIECPSVVVSNITHFASKSCFNIVGLGPKTTKMLLNKGLISSTLDLFSLGLKDLKLFEKFEYVDPIQIINSIKASQGIELSKFIYALGIESCGENICKIIANKFGNNFLNVTAQELEYVEKITKPAVKNYISYMNENKVYVGDLVNIVHPEVTKTKIQKNYFTNLNVVLTGTLSIGRNQVKEELESCGASVSSSISKKTNCLIYGENAGSKYTKALEMNIQVFDEVNYRKYIKQT